MNPSPLLANLVAYSLQIALLVGTGTLVLPLLRIRHPRARLLCWQLLKAASFQIPPSKGAAANGCGGCLGRNSPTKGTSPLKGAIQLSQ